MSLAASIKQGCSEKRILPPHFGLTGDGLRVGLIWATGGND